MFGARRKIQRKSAKTRIRIVRSWTERTFNIFEIRPVISLPALSCPRTLARPRRWHALRALTCGPFKHTTLKDLTHTRPQVFPPPPPPPRRCQVMHRRTLQHGGRGTRSNQSNRGQICFRCYSSSLGLFETEQTLFFNPLSIWPRPAWKCPCSTLNCCLRAAVITARCRCIYAFFQYAVPSGLPGLKENLCKVCCWGEGGRNPSCVRFVQSSCQESSLPKK